MRFLDSLNLRVKLRAMTAISVLTIAVLAAGYNFATSRLNATIAAMAHSSNILSAQGMADMMHDAIRADIVYILMLRQQNLPTTQQASDLAEHTAQFHSSLEEVEKLARDPGIVLAFKRARPETLVYTSAADAIAKNPLVHPESDDFKAFIGHFESLEESLGALGHVIDKSIDEEKFKSDELQALVNKGYTAIVGICLAGLGLIIVAASSINRRLGDFVKAVQAIARDETDLSQRLEVGTTRDEVAIAATALNNYLNSMTSIIDSLREASARLHAAVGNMIALASQTCEHVVEAGENIGRATVAVTQVAGSASGVAEFAQRTAKTTRDANQQSRAGIEVVGATVQGIALLTQNVSSSSIAIQNLMDQSQEVGRVLSVIRNVAEQTNLLALNAAIEAARAGEHGRGFAVVADEVRNLSSSTFNATGQIEGMIANLQSHVTHSVEMMQSSLVDAEQCRAKADSAGETFSKIVSAVDQVTTMNQEVEECAVQQRESADHLMSDMQRVNHLAQSAVATSQQIIEAAHAANDVAESLESTIMRFRTKKDTAHAVLF